MIKSLLVFVTIFNPLVIQSYFYNYAEIDSEEPIDQEQLLYDLGLEIQENAEGAMELYARMREDALNLSPKLSELALRLIDEMENFDNMRSVRSDWSAVDWYMHPPPSLSGPTNDPKKYIKLSLKNDYDHEAFKEYDYIFNEVHFLIHGFCPWYPFDGKSNFDRIGEIFFNISRDLVENFEWHPVIVMDWTDLATYSLPRYYAAKANTVEAAKALTKVIKFGPFSGARIHLVGHSLGAHLSGIASAGARKLGGTQVGRITGLDPAGPLYESGGKVKDWSITLSKKDANFVDVIHCDIDELGISINLGHKDTYPNGGKTQPGCENTLPGCSHSKCLDYYQESIWDRSVACSCDKECVGTEQGEHTRPDDNGIYC